MLSSGVFTLPNAFAGSSSSSVTLTGGIGTGSLVASSTDSPFTDIFIAIPAATNLSNGSLNGTYNAASLEFLNGDVANSSRNTFFPISANGQGGISTISVKGTANNGGAGVSMQSITGATYSLSANGSGTLTLPSPSGVSSNNVLISGNKTIYVSADSNVILGGSPSGYDLFIALKASGAALGNNFQGTYFTGTLINSTGPMSSGLYASRGAATELGTVTGAGTCATLKQPCIDELAYERANPAGGPDYEYTYHDHIFSNTTNGVAFGPVNPFQYAFSPDGNYLIIAGFGNNYQLTLYAKAPTPTGTGVFLNPMGAQNAASNVPFETGLSPGEFVTFYGTGLSPATLTAQSLPLQSSLGGIEVTLNGAPMPIYYVSSTQISAIVPYTAPSDGSVVTIQVNNNGTLSNSIQLSTSKTSPGVFTIPPSGIGNCAVLDVKYNLVSPANPAKIGDTISIFLTGLGAVNPPVTAGSAPPANPVVNQIQQVFIGETPATVSYQGLAPGLPGLYQVNAVIPQGVAPFSAADAPYIDLEIVTVDADNYMRDCIAVTK
ncbi:MAG: hypothetical protein JO062_23160 [Bryobacterales bacterium]|nr:hypothetical protein [Bryobacterales bacterium]